MAIIQQDILFLDWFGDKTRSMVSIPELSKKDFAVIYVHAVDKFGPFMKRINFWKLAKFISGLSQDEARGIRLPFRSTLTVSIRVLKVEGREVKVSLVLDDLKAPGPIAERMLRDIIARIRCGNIFVENGMMVGYIKLPYEVKLSTQKRPGVSKKTWTRTGRDDMSAERRFLEQQAGLHAH